MANAKVSKAVTPSGHEVLRRLLALSAQVAALGGEAQPTLDL